MFCLRRSMLIIRYTKSQEDLGITILERKITEHSRHTPLRSLHWISAYSASIISLAVSCTVIPVPQCQLRLFNNQTDLTCLRHHFCLTTSVPSRKKHRIHRIEDGKIILPPLLSHHPRGYVDRGTVQSVSYARDPRKFTVHNH